MIEDSDIIHLAAQNGHMSVRDQERMRELGRSGPAEIREALARTAEGHQRSSDAKAIRDYISRHSPRRTED